MHAVPIGTWRPFPEPEIERNETTLDARAAARAHRPPIGLSWRPAPRPVADDNAMTRLSGIRLLILGIVLWALAVWIFGAPPPTETAAAPAPASTGTTAAAPAPASTGTTAAAPAPASTGTTAAAPAPASTGTTAAAPAPASTGTTAEPGAGASGSAGIEATPTPPATAGRPPATSPNPDATAGSPTLRTGSTGITGTAPAPAPAATGDGARIALAPASGDSAAPSVPSVPPTPPAGPSASDAAGAGAGPAPGDPIPPRAPEPGSAQAGDSGIPPPPDLWFEHPFPFPPPPARSGSAATDGSAVAGQINAARRAAWEGRLADALAHYRAAARIQPDLHVVWGEMGNVLWEMRRWSEAAYALEGAATLLVRAGELRAASELVPAVGRIDPEAAYRVQRLLWVAAQRQSG